MMMCHTKEIGHATLFSGIGGPEIAAERLGWRSIFTCEWEGFPRKVLEYHYPKAKHYGDIRELDAREYRGQIDVLTGGFPCQPFSVAGSQKGATDDRYLWPEMLRVISECQPTWVIGENVAGIIPMAIQGAPSKVGNQGNLFGEGDTIYQRTDKGILEGICKDLEREGYEVWPVVIPAEAVGAPHRRDRIFIIAYTDKSSTEHEISARGDVPSSPLSSDVANAKHNGSSSTERGRSNGEDCKGGQEGTNSTEQFEGVCKPEELGGVQNAPNTNRERQERKRKQRILDEKRQRGEKRFGELGNTQHRWKKFPTQSPICSGDDGLPTELDGITFSKWRNESIKAYGNAIVPEVIFRIYQGINELTKNTNNE